MSETSGLHHLGLAVRDLDDTVRFFTDALGWTEGPRDMSYPRSSVSDGSVRLTLWQVDHSQPVTGFDRRQNIGLHHLALTVDSMARLEALTDRIAAHPGTQVEFRPEPMGQGPRYHAMFREPGGIRIELVWPGA